MNVPYPYGGVSSSSLGRWLLPTELPSQEGLPWRCGPRREGPAWNEPWCFPGGDISNELIGGKVILSCASVIVAQRKV